MHRSFTGLGGHPEFLKLWAGQSVSLVGSRMTDLALPLTASLALGATSFEMGVLGMVESLPYLLFGLFAGVWVDRLPRRRIMLAADLGRAALLGSVPLAALIGLLRLEQVYVVAFCTGTLSVFFGIAYGAFLPSLVRRDDLADANAKLALSESVALVGGPGLAGLLVQLATAPLAILLDAASFLVSATFLWRIRASEARRSTEAERASLWGELREGVQVLVGHPLLRALSGTFGLVNVGQGVLFGSNVYLLFATRDLGIEPAALGGSLSGLGIGSLIGAALTGPLTRRAGIGLSLVWGVGVAGSAMVALAFVGGPPLVASPLLTGTFAVFGVASPIATANVLSLRQAVTPDRLRGRVTGTMQVITWGALPAGALLGGSLAEVLGLRSTVAAAAGVTFLGLAWLLRSPIRSLREFPAASEAATR